MKHKTLTILLLIFALVLASQSSKGQNLSPTAKISLLTCGPGEAVWSKFGHSALWVFDTKNGVDKVYNYGTFDFYSSDFYLEFIRGTANYRLSITNYLNFHAEYEGENRSIISQELNLTSDEKQVLFDMLEENYLPENRYYRYDFLFLNCSSIIRDIVWEATDKRFKLPEDSNPKYTYRSMMIPYLSETPWLMNGEFILLGYKTDRNANPWNQMYLPDYMFNWFSQVVDSENEPLVSNTRTMFLPTPEDKQSSFLSHPNFILAVILLLIIGLTVKEIKGEKNYWFIDSIFFFVAGILGILMIITWTSSLHIVLHQNMNLVWAFPFHLIFALIIWMKRLRKGVRIYSRLMAPITLIFLCFFWLLPQAIPSTAVFMCAILLIRLIRWGEYTFIVRL